MAICGGWCLGTAVAGAVGLALVQWRWRPVVQWGPHCPACGYCLIGLPEHRCPECGRPFTLAELGIAAADLHPPPSPQASPAPARCAAPPPSL